MNYTTGLDRYYGLLELAEKYDVIKKVSTRYEFPDGSKHFAKAINTDPEKFFTEDIMERLEQARRKGIQIWRNRSERDGRCRRLILKNFHSIMILMR